MASGVRSAGDRSPARGHRPTATGGLGPRPEARRPTVGQGERTRGTERPACGASPGVTGQTRSPTRPVGPSNAPSDQSIECLDSPSRRCPHVGQSCEAMRSESRTSPTTVPLHSGRVTITATRWMAGAPNGTAKRLAERLQGRPPGTPTLSPSELGRTSRHRPPPPRLGSLGAGGQPDRRLIRRPQPAFRPVTLPSESRRRR